MSEPAADAAPADDGSGTTRRGFLIAGGATLGLGAIGGLAVATGAVEVPGRVSRIWQGSGPTAGIPDIEVGQVTYDVRRSEARGRDVGFFTAVPAGHGDGAGLPVCLVLHGASARAADFERFGLPQFLTAVVEAGAPPFVLAGADGGANRWQPVGDDDPQAMMRDEVPTWCDQLGWDASRMAAHGWSMGGYGSLLLAALHPGWLRGVAVLSPALGGGMLDPRIGDLDGERIAVWCGTDDAVFDGVEAFAEAVPGGLAITGFGPGRHTRGYWNTVTEDALTFVANALV